MGRISDEDIERVRAASDLVSLAGERIILKQRGRDFWACCPFHQEKTPSFKIDPSLNTWYCFGCSEGGDVFSFVQKMDNLDFPEAVRYLADRANIEITETGGPSAPKGHKERLKEVCRETADFYHAQLMRDKGSDAAAARSYLAGRGFGSDVCKRWCLGFAPGHGVLVRHLTQKGFTKDEIAGANVALENDKGQLRDRFYNRVMFPIYDKLGANIAFGGRVIGEGEPKYLNSSETLIFHKSNNLFGIDKAKAAITANACAVVVEGYTDVISLHEAGVQNAVATLGTALTQQHIKLLRSMRPKKIVYLFDGDNAGQKAADRAIEFIDRGITPEAGGDFIEFLVCVLPGGADPAEYVGEHGKEGMEAQIASAQPLIRFAIDRRLAAWDLNSPEQKASALAEAVGLLAPIKGSIVASDYCNYIADRLASDVTIVNNALSKAQPRKTYAPRKSEDAEQTQAPVQRDSVTDPALEKTASMERELLSLIAKNPSCRKILSEATGKFTWSAPLPADIAVVFLSDDSPDTPTELVSFAESKVPGAASYLAAGTVEVKNDEEVFNVVIMFLSELIENDLRKRIRLGNAKLKNPAQMSEQEYDVLFEETSMLQKQLNELRATLRETMEKRIGHDRP